MWTTVSDMVNEETQLLQFILSCAIKKISQAYRRSGAGVGVLNGYLYAIGGHDGPMVRRSVEKYDPDTKSWSMVADMSLCRRNAGESE